MRKIAAFLLFTGLLFSSGCTPKQGQNQAIEPTYEKGSFGYDLNFLKKHQETIVLENGDAKVALVAAYQGRVMTSSAKGLSGESYGWLNYDLIKSDEKAAQFNNYGGEERFWLGPEGGQYSIFFPPGVSFAFENWQVPGPIDHEPFNLVSNDKRSAHFQKDIKLLNYANFEFNLRVDRKIKLEDAAKAKQLLGFDLQGVDWVAYTSENTITNTGDQPWQKNTGLLSIWVLGQFISSPANTVLVPFISGSEEELGPIVNDEYFGKVPEDRLTIQESILYFKADGKKRSKIGLTPQRSRNYIGSYDPDAELLTVVFYDKPEKYTGYVNSMWELQEKPYAGDIINSYNDGPLDDGTQLGPFYELETSSPAAELKPEQKLTHNSTTFHISGTSSSLEPIITGLFDVKIEDIKNAFK